MRFSEKICFVVYIVSGIVCAYYNGIQHGLLRSGKGVCIKLACEPASCLTAKIIGGIHNRVERACFDDVHANQTVGVTATFYYHPLEGLHFKVIFVAGDDILAIFKSIVFGVAIGLCGMSKIPFTVGAEIVALIVLDIGDGNVISFDGLGIFAKVEIAVDPLIGGVLVGGKLVAAVVTLAVFVIRMNAAWGCLLGDLSITANGADELGKACGNARGRNNSFFVAVTVIAGIGADRTFALFVGLVFANGMVAAGIELVVIDAICAATVFTEAVSADTSPAPAVSALCVEAILTSQVTAFQFGVAAVADIAAVASFTPIVGNVYRFAVSVVSTRTSTVVTTILAKELTAGGTSTMASLFADIVIAGIFAMSDAFFTATGTGFYCGKMVVVITVAEASVTIGAFCMVALREGTAANGTVFVLVFITVAVVIEVMAEEIAADLASIVVTCNRAAMAAFSSAVLDIIISVRHTADSATAVWILVAVGMVALTTEAAASCAMIMITALAGTVTAIIQEMVAFGNIALAGGAEAGTMVAFAEDVLAVVAEDAVSAFLASVVAAIEDIVISIAFTLLMATFYDIMSAMADETFTAGIADLVNALFAGEVAAVKTFVIQTVAYTVIKPTVGVFVVAFTYVSSADLTRIMVTFCTAEVAAVGYLVFFAVIIVAGVVFAARQVYMVSVPAGMVTAVNHIVIARIANMVEAMDHVVIAALTDSVVATFCDGMVFGEHNHFPTAFAKRTATFSMFTLAEISLAVNAKGMVPFLAGAVVTVKKLVGVARHTASGTADNGHTAVAVVNVRVAVKCETVGASIVVAAFCITVAAIHLPMLFCCT